MSAERDDLLLSVAEVRRFTGYSRRSSQARVLRERGVPFRIRDDGILLVARVAAERWLTGGAANDGVAVPDQEWTVDVEALEAHGKASAARRSS